MSELSIKEENPQLLSLSDLTQEATLKLGQHNSIISSISKELNIDLFCSHMSQAIELFKQILAIISSSYDFLKNSQILKDDFHNSILVINTAFDSYFKSLNSISSSPNQQNLINIIDRDVSNFIQVLSIFATNIKEIISNISALDQINEPHQREIDLLSTRLGLECVLFNLSVNVQPTNTSPFFKSKYVGVYKHYNTINNFQNPICALKSFCGTGKTNFIPLILMCRILKDEMKSPFIVLTQPSPKHVDNKAKFFQSAISRYVTITTKSEEFERIVDDYENNPQNLTKIVFAVMTPPDLLPLMYEMRKYHDFYSNTRMIIDEIHQRTFHIDVLISKISELNNKFKIFQNPMNVVFMSASISQQVLSPFRETVSVTSLIENPQYEIIERQPIMEHFIEKINNEVVRDETVKIINEMAKINNNDESSIENGHILCFLSSVATCNKVCNSVISILNEISEETDDRKKIIILETKPKSNEPIERFYERLRKEYQLSQQFNEIEDNKYNFFYVISFIFSGIADSLISELVLNDFPDDLSGITKLIYSTPISESFNFENISVVIDSGLVREAGFDLDTSLTTLVKTQASKEAMYQRKGRLGRSMKGLYIPIISNKDVPDIQTPAIQRLDLTANVLLMKDINIDFEKLKNLPIEPDTNNINFALENLKYIKAINQKNLKITDFGHEILSFPFMSIYYAAAVVQLKEKFPKNDKNLAYFIAAYISTIISMESLLIKEELTEKLSRLFCEDSDVTTVFNALNLLLKSEITDNDKLRDEVESYGFSYSSYLQFKDNLKKIANITFPDKTVKEIITDPKFDNFIKENKGISSIIDMLICEIEYTYPNWCDIHYIKFKKVKGACNFESRPTIIFDGSEYLTFKKKVAKAEVRILKRPGWNGITIPTECYCFNISRNKSYQVNNGYLIHRVPNNSLIAITSIEVDQIALNPWFNVLLEIYCSNEIKQCTPFQNKEKSTTEMQIFHYSNVGGRVFVSFIPNQEIIKQKICDGIKKCLLLMPYTPKSLLIYRNDAQTLIEVRIIGTQNYESLNADFFHGDFLDKKKIDFCVKNIDKLMKSESDLRISALFSRETCLLDEYDQNHLFLINANYRDMPLISDVILKRIIQINEENRKSRQLKNYFIKNAPKKIKNNIGLYEFPPRFIHPALVHHQQSRECILKWFNECCEYAKVIRVIGHRFLMKKEEIKQLQDHLHNESNQIKEQMNLNYVAIPVPAKVYSRSYQIIQQHTTWNYNSRFKVIITKNSEAQEVIDFLNQTQSEIKNESKKDGNEEEERQPDSVFVSENMLTDTLCCWMMCDDPDNPVLTDLPLTLYFKDGSKYTDRICRSCMYHSLLAATEYYFHNGKMDHESLVNIQSKPSPIATFESKSIDGEIEFWPQIPIGQLISVLINNDKELSLLVSAWLNIIADFTIRTQLKHRFVCCPKHPNRVFDLEKRHANAYKCVVPDCKNEYCAFCTGFHNPNIFCIEKKQSYAKSRMHVVYKKVKQCPKCHVSTIKDGGCNHISCPCGCHWCYKCGQGFNSASRCYSHMNSGHGGIFDFNYF